MTMRAYDAADLDWIVRADGRLYARDEGFDDTFAPLVEEILRDFTRHRDPERERGWVAEEEGAERGCIFCVKGHEGRAKLRLFLVLPEARGLGLGQQLLDACMGFAREAGYTGMELWTHESHRAACALYALNGWRVVRSEAVRSFSVDLVAQTWLVDF